MISQSNFIAGALVVGFLFFITARGELSKYVAIFTGSGGTSTPSVNAASGVTSSGNNILNAASTGTITNNPLPVGTVLPAQATGNPAHDILYVFGD